MLPFFGGSIIPIGEVRKAPLRVNTDQHSKLEFHGGDISTDAGLLPCSELDGALGLTELGEEFLSTTQRKRID